MRSLLAPDLLLYSRLSAAFDAKTAATDIAAAAAAARRRSEAAVAACQTAKTTSTVLEAVASAVTVRKKESKMPQCALLSAGELEFLEAVRAVMAMRAAEKETLA